MNFYFHQTPEIFSTIFPKRIWRMPNHEKTVYLTFDDGPVPGVTDFVLKELEKRGQKATFFVVGDNVRKSPGLARQLIEEDHALGNHTFNHLHGLKNKTHHYLQNIDRCQKTIEDLLSYSPRYFRPPYGMLKSAQAKSIHKEFEIVMWSFLSGDFDSQLSPKQILQKSVEGLSPGSILVFHDQEKTKEVIRDVLPRFLDAVKDQGWKTLCL